MIPPVRKFALKRVRQLLEEGTSTPVLSWTVKKVLQAKRKLLPGKIQNTKYKIQNTKYKIQNTCLVLSKYKICLILDGQKSSPS